MKKTIYLISLIAVLTLTSCQNSLQTNHTVARAAEIDNNSVVEAMQLPEYIVVPTALPTTIEDSILLEGWIRLYNKTQYCELTDGYSITGKMLAQYVVEHHVTITWNTNPDMDGSWADRDNSGTLYISTKFQEKTATQMDNLVSELAHEIFHDLTPFNQKADTVYEEYYAFYTGACVAGLSTTTIKLYDPQSPDALAQYFTISRHSNYLDWYEMYPAEMAEVSLP